MVPTTLTVDAIFGGAAGVVPYFGSLMLLVLVIGFGLWAVRYVIGLISRSKGGGGGRRRR